VGLLDRQLAAAFVNAQFPEVGRVPVLVWHAGPGRGRLLQWRGVPGPVDGRGRDERVEGAVQALGQPAIRIVAAYQPDVALSVFAQAHGES
jgi:hypothetical protein